MAPVLKLTRLPHAADLPLPARGSAGAAGFDLAAAIGGPRLLAPGARALIPTGFIFELPADHEAQIRPRSGLALRHGITVLNSPGTVDADYRGEVQVLLINLSTVPFEITPGMRIAQCVVAKVAPIEIVEVSEASETARGTGGFGSTGI